MSYLPALIGSAGAELGVVGRVGGGKGQGLGKIPRGSKKCFWWNAGRSRG